MKSIVLFEDSPSSPISDLLKYVFRREVDFCETCDLFKSKVTDYLDLGYENIVCYFDTPPDNPKAVIAYRSLSSLFKNNDNVHILKAQAIEHYVLKAFVDVGTVLRNSSLIDKYKDIQEAIPTEYSDPNYEKFCKNVLNGNKRICVKNMSKVLLSWYKVGCCSDVENADCTAGRYSLDQKRLMLMWALPYYPAYQKDEYLREMGYLLNTSIENADRLCKEEFEKIRKAVCKE